MSDKFCPHGIDSWAMSQCPACIKDREAGKPQIVICPHYPNGRAPYTCAECLPWVKEHLKEVFK